ncbi:cytochrome P450 [Sphingomonas histidinilytica]|uniref:cytochrome P450 n=1 Tax=Rhizorhabdus histidinilytica TaxID=439228 RepID=UPI001ADA020E|nr:cytochrome P450 [Rhizorhabdus histidinilytica]MBO9379646.1 cytochrome P450 [Rhizorhabdus histidinilytica]
MSENSFSENGTELLEVTSPAPIDISGLETVEGYGFSGGRDSLKQFCRNVFAKDEPRFLRNADNDLVVFRYADLRALNAIHAVANVPPSGWYPGLTLEEASTPLPADGQWPPRLAIATILSNQFFTMNPPIHAPVRKILVSQIGPKQIAQLEGLAREIIAQLIDELPNGEVVDFAAEFCDKMTARFFGTILGMTEEEKLAIVESVREMMPLFHLSATSEEQDQLDVGAAHWRHIMETATLRTLRSGKSEMLNNMAEALAKIQHEEDIDTVGMVPRNLGAFVAGNLIDAFHTIAVGACNTMYALLHHPDALAQIQQSPDLIPRAVVEGLRLESPAIFFRRYVLEDVVYDGYLIPKGTYVANFWSAGNHDPKAFPDPEQFRFDRDNVGTLTFGGGLHICPGRYAAAMLIRMMLEMFNENHIELEPVDTSSQWIGNHFMSQLRVMNVRVSKG